MTSVPAPPVSREPIRTREVRWPTVTLFLSLSLGLLTLFPLVRRAGPMARVVLPGWLENLVTFGSLLVVAVAVLYGLGRLSPADLGLGRKKLVQGLVTIGAVWGLNQVLAAALALASTGTVEVAPAWTTTGVGPTLLWTAVIFLTTALFEEIAFRGFLFPQLYLKLHGSHRARFWIALLASQVLFAVAHIPGHLFIRHLSGPPLWTQVALQGVSGVLLLLVYLRTRNLWIAVGLHGLANAPTPLVSGTMSWEIPLLVLLVGWPWLTRKPESHGFGRVEAAGPTQTIR